MILKRNHAGLLSIEAKALMVHTIRLGKKV